MQSLLIALAAFGLSCTSGQATAHDAWSSVFAHFPDRYDERVVAYVALRDCSRIGDDVLVILPPAPPTVMRVADCLNPAHPISSDWVADVDARFWRGHRVPWTPMPVIVCDLPKRKNDIKRDDLRNPRAGRTIDANTLMR